MKSKKVLYAALLLIGAVSACEKGGVVNLCEKAEKIIYRTDVVLNVASGVKGGYESN